MDSIVYVWFNNNNNNNNGMCGCVWGKVSRREMDEALRAYLFHLVGCTLFSNKSATYVEVKFLDFFMTSKDVAGIHGGQLP